MQLVLMIFIYQVLMVTKRRVHHRQRMGDKSLAIQWPNAQDFNEAVQFPEVSFDDAELQNGEVELTPIGLPKVACGNFASVYRFSCGSKDYAVKCFLRNVYDQHRRYSLLSQYTMTTNVPHMVDFEYILKGIRIEENWFPIVKMEWVDGLGFDMFFRKNWNNREQINRVINQFVELMSELQRLGIAHCDLQHGNILVKNDALRLVDYDNMFVPQMAGEMSAELGHANYQHLQRSEKDFGPQVDNFSAWIIYYSLYFLRLDPALWQRFEGGDDCLIFRKSDFANPENSRLLNEIKNHQIPDIKAQYDRLMTLLRSPLSTVPQFAPFGSSGNGGRPASISTSGSPTQDMAKPPPVYPSVWPTAEKFFWSAVKPTKAYSDEKLARGVPVPTEGRTTSYIEVDATTQDTVQLHKLAIRGRNHIVFHVVGEDDGQGNRRHYAVKCFLNNLPDRHIRYSALHKHEKTHSKKYFVPFVYQAQGIKVGDSWFPILKMIWVQGQSLEDYIKKQLEVGYPVAIQEMLPKFVKLIDALSADGIAHGDLEPSNILVDEYGELKIVDYDTMYVPALANLQACETGFKVYQHPTRNLNHYGNYLDNYSALAIYGLLVCMSKKPPPKFWQWDNLLQHIRSQSGGLKPEVRKSSDGMLVPKQQWVHDSKKEGKHFGMGQNTPFLGGMYPVFEKVSASDTMVGDFDTAMQKLARVLREQQKRRIDQVAKLDVNVWNLS